MQVLDGTIFPRLRGGLGLRSPGILGPDSRTSMSSRRAIKDAILTDFDVGLITSETIRSPDPVKVLEGNFLEKGVRNLEFPLPPI